MLLASETGAFSKTPAIKFCARSALNFIKFVEKVSSRSEI